MKTTLEYLLHPALPMKPREDRIAPALGVRLQRRNENAFRYEADRWECLPGRIANAFARFEDKSRNAIRERSFM